MKMEQARRPGLTSFNLKIIAMAAMLCDHVAYGFLPEDSIAYGILRAFGRIAFILFAFMIAEGYLHTRNVRKYLLRLGIFAVISEIPFDLFISGVVWNTASQNVFVTLFLGLLAITLAEAAGKKLSKKALRVAVKILIVAALAAAAWLLKSDYDAGGVLIITSFFYFRKNYFLLGAGFVAVSLLILSSPTEIYGLMAFPLLYYYNGEKGRSAGPVLYAFYPLHLLVLAALRMVVP